MRKARALGGVISSGRLGGAGAIGRGAPPRSNPPGSGESPAEESRRHFRGELPSRLVRGARTHVCVRPGGSVFSSTERVTSGVHIEPAARKAPFSGAPSTRDRPKNRAGRSGYVSAAFSSWERLGLIQAPQGRSQVYISNAIRAEPRILRQAEAADEGLDVPGNWRCLWE